MQIYLIDITVDVLCAAKLQTIWGSSHHFEDNGTFQFTMLYMKHYILDVIEPVQIALFEM